MNPEGYRPEEQRGELPNNYISLQNGMKEGKLGFVRCDVHLPEYVGELGINGNALLYLARIAGFRSIRITSNAQDSSETAYNLQGGIGADNTLQGSISTATTYVEEADSNLLFDEDFEGEYIPRGRMWGDLAVTLNTKEIQRTIVEEEHKGAQDKKAWAHHLNRAILNEIFEKGAYNLLRGGTIRNDISTILQGPIAVEAFDLLRNLASTGNILQGPVTGPGEFVVRSIWNLFWMSYIFKVNFRRGNGPARMSLLGVHAPALDRAAILFTAAEAMLLKGIVKPAKEV